MSPPYKQFIFTFPEPFYESFDNLATCIAAVYSGNMRTRMTVGTKQQDVGHFNLTDGTNSNFYISGYNMTSTTFTFSVYNNFSTKIWVYGIITTDVEHLFSKE